MLYNNQKDPHKKKVFQNTKFTMDNLQKNNILIKSFPLSNFGKRKSILLSSLYLKRYLNKLLLGIIDEENRSSENIEYLGMLLVKYIHLIKPQFYTEKNPITNGASHQSYYFVFECSISIKISLLWACVIYVYLKVNPKFNTYTP